jgi:hypothetical protein
VKGLLLDDKDLPQVKNIDHFYVNPYSGDLSVDFPAQEQHCLSLSLLPTSSEGPVAGTCADQG